MSQAGSPLLELSNVTAAYGSTVVLRDVSLQVVPGQVVALLGPNGAGKTTTLRAATGLLRPKAGSVLVDGQPVTRVGPHKRAALGICHIPEGRGIFRNLTVRENLVMYLAPGDKSASLDSALDAFPMLGQRLHQVAGTLSGGQQQMLALSRAYLCQPRLVMLDEVSMGLAPLIVDEIFTSLRALAANGVALLLVEQYINRALEMANSVVLLNHGSVRYSGPATEIDEDKVLAAYLGGDDLGESLELAVEDK